MRYYIMEAQNKVTLPKAERGADIKTVTAAELNSFSEIDYDMNNALISENFKNLMKMYMPKYDFKPFIYIVPLDKQIMYDYFIEASKAKGNPAFAAKLNPQKPNQLIFWRFEPPKLQLNEDYNCHCRSDGVMSHISFLGKKMPIVFTTSSPKGVCSVVVRMAVAESALRRNFISLKFTKLMDM